MASMQTQANSCRDETAAPDQAGEERDGHPRQPQESPDFEGHPGGDLQRPRKGVLGVEIEKSEAVAAIDRHERADDQHGRNQARNKDAAEGDAVLRAIDQDEGDGERGGAGGDAAAHGEAEEEAGEEGLFAQGAPPGRQQEGERPGEIF